MNIHEYQAKELFRQNGVSVPQGEVVQSALEAEFAYTRLKSPICVVKAQIHAGGRGKAGGVKLAKSAKECGELTQKMLGTTLVTHQTGPEGKVIRKVYIEQGSQIEKEYYLAMLVDRETASIALIFSTEGGMDIEEVAEKTPQKLRTVCVDPTIGLKGFQLINLTRGFGLDPVIEKKIHQAIPAIYKMFLKYDFSMLEINPLVQTKQGDIFALDGKMNFDDNALYRHPEIARLRDFYEEDPREVEASKFGLSYIGLEGNIGCLVNGAGLAMATMDIIKFYGGLPANFLDVGGGATEEMVKNAFRIILQDPQVKGIFVNIFGGIMKCDVIASGVIGATKELGLKIPLVVRLEGTRVEEGKKLLNSSGLQITTADGMADGAEKIVNLVKKSK